MNYEIVDLNEKIVVGFSAKTSNDDPDMRNIIGGLWQKLYGPEGVSEITGRINTYSIGLYSDYEEDGTYQVTAGFEVSDKNCKDLFTVKIIPAGRYAKFSIHGDMVTAVAELWEEIWNTPLERTFTGDFEEYTSMEDIDIYIAIK